MPTLDDLRALGRKVQDLEDALNQARCERDTAIRDVRLSTKHTVPEIAEAANVSPATIKTVIRGLSPNSVS